MAAPSIETVQSWQGRTMVDPAGDKLGTIDAIYLDDETGQPEWATVTSGLFSAKIAFVPLAQAQDTGDSVQVPYDKQQVKDAPAMQADGSLSQDDEAELYRHYGLDYSEHRSDSGLPAGTAGQGIDSRDRNGDGVYDDVPDSAVSRDTSGPITDDAMTRSEEELRVGTESRERGRARLRKYVTTETQTVTVPVQREEVRVEREPITDANLDATSGPAISEEDHEVTLHEETPVVDKRAVPRERVRLDTETVTEERQVSEEVRKEHIEVEGDQDQLPRQDQR
jgi:uncharacterized protein (TIGR02271 family)